MPHQANLFLLVLTGKHIKVNEKMRLHKPSNRKYFVLTVAAAIVIGYAGFAFFRKVQAEPAKADRQEVQMHAGVPTPLKKSPVHLFFIDRSNNFLTSEQRVVNHAGDRVSLARVIVEALINGPQGDLLQTMPPGTQLNAIYVTPESVCYLDLSGEIRNNHPGGSITELLTIYSMVNSLILNVPEIERVKILIDGTEALTLAGHISLQFPAKANMLLIR